MTKDVLRSCGDGYGLTRALGSGFGEKIRQSEPCQRNFFSEYAGDFLHEADGIQGCLDHGGQTRGHLYLQVLVD
jgi:hypothetical protein